MITKSRADIMGMPITVSIVDAWAIEENLDMVFTYFQNIDNRFSTYKKNSEISLFNQNKIPTEKLSSDMQEIFQLSEQTKQETNGYFDIKKTDGTIDPSGLVKGFAIDKAAQLLGKKGFRHFFIDAGGDMQVSGKNEHGKCWRVGIRHPFQKEEIVKVVLLSNKGIATSGTYVRGQHVYNPHQPIKTLQEIVSISVIGQNAYEADRFATAAFAMQGNGIYFIESLPGFEGYMIDKNGMATMTTGFEKYTA